MTQKGQSLLEIVTLTGVILAVVTGLTITVINGLKNSQFSQNQTQATKLAQEGLEEVRTIRDRNWMVCIQGGAQTVLAWKDIFANNYTFGNRNPAAANPCRTGPASQASSCIYRLNPTATCASLVGGAPANTTYTLMSSQLLSNLDIPETFPGTPFKRTIFVEDDVSNPTTQKKVTSRVSWTDFSGTHQSEIVTVLASQ